MRTPRVLLKGCHDGALLLPRDVWEALAAACSKPFPKLAEVGVRPFPVGAALALFAFLRGGRQRLQRGQVCWLTPLVEAWPEVFTETRLRQLCQFLRRSGGFAVLGPDEDEWPRGSSAN
jgi:hypothetical protein